MSEKRRLQLSLEPDVLEHWTREAARMGVPISTWVTIRANRPEPALEQRMDRLIEVLDTLSLNLARCADK